MCFWHLPSRHLVRRGGKHQQSRNTTNIKHLQSDLWIGLETTAREKKTSLLELSTVPPPFMPVLSFSSLFFAHRRTATATCLGSLSGLFYFKSDLNPESLRKFFSGWEVEVTGSAPEPRPAAATQSGLSPSSRLLRTPAGRRSVGGGGGGWEWGWRPKHHNIISRTESWGPLCFYFIWAFCAISHIIFICIPIFVSCDALCF